ncbi:NAD(P)-dependent alcohol dehydrogenase [Nitrospirillum sp. BR 11164]|uniref:NAD(P)-dependent alcohol dehydrogenase n=1 Tax=Nitrospirillum sp. BR 11164 TaxID=3104324 RepID=UPI002AFF21A6|nr:NAD(P)-dependent alcohol dehydrogenase [Nitrospirillum sp. BR 11164]MEA1648604.1 NAD(P)-dependent alcohol dehydrogenase [Nitrospirillum sp. BR 11164]
MQITAAVAHGVKAPLTLETVEIEDPRPGEVLVRVVATGVCHTDMAMRDQELPVPPPAVLGHEGAGIVMRVGAGVTRVAPGDRVVMSFNSCGACPSCDDHLPAYCHDFFGRNFSGRRADGSSGLRWAGQPLGGNVFGQSSFATHALCHERNVVTVPATVPLEILGPLGCGVLTGAGAVMNALRVGPRRSLAVFGTGAVGLSAVMAARVMGAAPLIAIDVVEARLDLARELGATHAFNPTRTSVVEEIMALTGGIGVDYALDTTARPAVVGDAVRCLAPRGVCGLVGAMPFGQALPVDGGHLMSGGRAVRGIVEGDADPHHFIPALIDLHLAGQFPFDRLITFYPLAEINQAIHDAETGRTVKPVLRMPGW